MKHDLGECVSIEYESEKRRWVSEFEVDGNILRYSSTALIDVVTRLEERGMLDVTSFEVVNQDGVEQVLVVV